MEYNENDYQPYHPYHEPKKKKHPGALIALVVLALLVCGISWAVNVLNVHVDIGRDGVSIEKPEKPELLETTQPFSPPEKPPVREDAALEIDSSVPGIENYPISDGNALSLQQIYETVYPSVASISCIHQGGSGTGTGIVMTKDGYVITNYHVIESARQIYVLLADDIQYPAQLVGGDEITDLAVLKVDAQNLQPARFGDSDRLRVGDAVVAIGDPLGTELRGTMTDGIISAINRDLNLSGRQMTLIQTNAALNSGNSGGPLINCYGQVIGINTMKMSNYSYAGTTIEGLGFAIPITQAKPILDELISQGFVSGRPAIGIEGQTVDLRMQLFYRLPAGVIVTDTVEGSDAVQKGLEPDDVIVELSGQNIDSLDDLVAAKANLAAGDTVHLTIYRAGRYYSADITLIDQITPDIY